MIFDFIKYNCPRGNDYELSWALWILKSFKIKVPKPVAELLSGCSDSVNLLIILDLINVGLIEKADINVDDWEKKLISDSLLDENWLFAYENSVKKWVGTDFSYIDKVSYFKILNSNKISFYNPDKQVEVLDTTSGPVVIPDDGIDYTTTSTIETTETEKVETYSNFIGDEDDDEFEQGFSEDDVDMDYFN